MNLDKMDRKGRMAETETEPTLKCTCGWRGTKDEMDAGYTVCGCCPWCGNEDLEFV